MEAKIAAVLNRLQTGAADSSGELKDLVNDILKSKSANLLGEFVRQLLADEINFQISRAALSQIANQLKPLATASTTCDQELFNESASYIVGLLKQHSSSGFDEIDFTLRNSLFEYCINMEEYSAGAQYLSGANLESTSHPFSDRDKADIYIKCAEAVFEADEAVDAEVYMNKASALINDVENDMALTLRFRVTYARVLDANRKFVEAAQRYYELSNTTSLDVVHDDLLELLAKAATCAVLGKSGQPRSRVLALLGKDPRLASLDQNSKYSAHSAVLLKMYNEQMLRKGELDVFEAALMPHQRAITKEGYTLLEKAVMEHNMMAVSKLYSDIQLVELASIVSLDVAHAEKVVASMITEKRLDAEIDQTEGFVYFGSPGGISSSSRDRGEVTTAAIISWNSGIRALCQEITDFSERSQLQYPT